MKKARTTSFNASVLEDVDSNGDSIKTWCRGGPQSSEAKCVICDVVISCAQHGTSAVRRHASSKMYLKSMMKFCDAEGKFAKPKLAQPTLTFSGGAATLTVKLSLTVKGVPFSFADTASRMVPVMFSDSKIAEMFFCGRTKAPYIISDGLDPLSRKKVMEELCWPDVYYSIKVDETPKADQHVQQLDILVRYFSKTQEKVVVQHL
ncbi:hypothetical protein MRX96_003434 [Rhipicephalus microplus]|nr:uncharacterized protein LOC119178428 isoform X2 [Rhipicephalus microplus]